MENKKVETKSEAFKRIAAKRATEAIKMIRKIGEMNTPAYEYTDPQLEALFGTLRAEIKRAEDKLRSGEDEALFTF